MKPTLTLRDLFWLVLVCAMGLGWWLERSENARFRRYIQHHSEANTDPEQVFHWEAEGKLNEDPAFTEENPFD